MRTPITPVIRPPVRKEMQARIEIGKIVGGRDHVGRDIGVERGDEQRDQRDGGDHRLIELPSSTTGSQMGSPKITTDAEVTATPMKE